MGGVYLYSLKKAIAFLLEYWLILFTLFFPFYAASVNGNVDWILIAKSLVGYNGIISFAWYVWFFLGLLVILPLLRYCFPKNMKWWIALIIALIPLTAAVLIWTFMDKGDIYDSWRGALSYAISAVMGCALARTNGIEGVRGLLSKAKIDKAWFYLITSILALVLYGIIHKAIMSPYVALPIVVLFASLSERNVPNWIMFIAKWLALLSMPIWFIHCAFFTGYINQYVPLFLDIPANKG